MAGQLRGARRATAGSLAAPVFWASSANAGLGVGNSVTTGDGIPRAIFSEASLSFFARSALAFIAAARAAISRRMSSSTMYQKLHATGSFMLLASASRFHPVLAPLMAPGGTGISSSIRNATRPVPMALRA